MLRKRRQLYVRDEPLGALNALNGVLVQINAHKLHFVRQRPLRVAGLHPKP